MSYLQEFQKQIDLRNFSKILVLWEEYCANDRVDAEEFIAILDSLKKSDFKEQMGTRMEEALPLWKLIQTEEEGYRVLRSIIDLQTTQSPILAETAFNALQKRYGTDPLYEERIPLVGLRTKRNFQGALSYYELLDHMKKGNVVYHEGGWGTGEIMDVSRLREHVIIEFENLAGKKDLSFANAFKSLIPLPPDHFLARRFMNPDELEQEARRDPLAVIKLLLKDLGPMTASEIKDALCELVIPEADWTRWWQGARSRLKKDPFIESPKDLKSPFRLRHSQITHEERVENSFEGKKEPAEWIGAVYQIVRDQPEALKNPEIEQQLREKLLSSLAQKETSESQKLMILLLLENYFQQSVEGTSMVDMVKQLEKIPETLEQIEILAFKKRILSLIQKHRPDWQEIFLSLLVRLPQGMVKEMLFQALEKSEAKGTLEETLRELAHHPKKSPETFFWYFQQLFYSKKSHLPFQDSEGRALFFEAFLILYSQIEWLDEYKDLVKKMYQILSDKRFLLVRNLLKERDLSFAKEFLLLASKCQTISGHDQKILRSLAEVAHPSLKREGSQKGSVRSHDNVIWTTEEGYLRTQEQIKRIGTVEIIDNAREIEAARALGDLRENSEYKFACERRSWLQGQLKNLSQQLSRARILTPHDVSAEQVDVGTIVEVQDLNGKTARYTILGPWDADSEKNILSFQSKFAEAMIGCRRGETFSFREDTYEIVNIASFFDQKL